MTLKEWAPKLNEYTSIIWVETIENADLFIKKWKLLQLRLYEYKLVSY